jgi:hypothetical protein
MRTLHVGEWVLHNYPHLQMPLSILDNALPNLQKLVIIPDDPIHPGLFHGEDILRPLTGMSKVRVFVFRYHNGTCTGPS